MDLTVSPDLEALYCYGLVFAIGLLVARRQVALKMASFKGVWLNFQTWLLFLAYSLLPVGLFWVLDRTGAIHDTSLFAALIIGFGYRQVLEGSLTTIRTPGEISAFWKPFVAWADQVALQITGRVMRRDARFRDRVVAELARDASRVEPLRVLVESRTKPEKLPALRQELAAIDETYGSLGEGTVHEIRVKHLYECVTELEDFEFLLYRRGITRRWTYYWYAQEWRSKTLALAVALVLASGLIFGLRALNTPQNWVSYYSWRLSKPGTTELDRYRTRRELRTCLAAEDPHTAHETCKRLAALLLRPDLPTDRVEPLLQLLIENHKEASGADELVAALVGSLRSENQDIRVHIHTALLYLAARWRLSVPPDLSTWNPSLQVSPTELEQRIEAWREALRPVRGETPTAGEVVVSTGAPPAMPAR